VLQLGAKSLKATVVLAAAQLAGLEVPSGPHLRFQITIDGRRVTGAKGRHVVGGSAASLAPRASKRQSCVRSHKTWHYWLGSNQYFEDHNE